MTTSLVPPASASTAVDAVAAWARDLPDLDPVAHALVTIGRGREVAATLLGGTSLGTPQALLTDTTLGSVVTSSLTLLARPAGIDELGLLTAGGRGPIDLYAPASYGLTVPGWMDRGAWQVIRRPVADVYAPAPQPEGITVTRARDQAGVSSAAAVLASHGDAAANDALDVRLLADGACRVLVAIVDGDPRGAAVAAEVEGTDVLLGLSAGGAIEVAAALVQAWLAERPFVPALAVVPEELPALAGTDVVGAVTVGRLVRS